MKILCTSDWHLRKNVPICRKETEQEWFDFQFSIVNQITELAKSYNATLCIAGDIFDKSFPGMAILNKLLDTLDFSNLVVSAGNHEIPYHNSENLINSAIYTIRQKIVNTSKIISYRDYNNSNYTEKEVMLCHHLVFKDSKSIPPNVNAITANDLLEMYPDSKIIICGDNHHGFIYKKNDRLVIVPGCTTIQTVSEFNHLPVVYLVDTETLNIEKIELYSPISMLTDNHIEQKVLRDQRIVDFVDKLQNKKLNSFDFTANLKQACNQDIELDVKNIIFELLEKL